MEIQDWIKERVFRQRGIHCLCFVAIKLLIHLLPLQRRGMVSYISMYKHVHIDYLSWESHTFGICYTRSNIE